MEKIFIIGDSYSTYENYIPEGYEFYYSLVNPTEEVRPTIGSVENTWWKILSDELDYEIVMNDSYSGSTISTNWQRDIHTSFIDRIDKYIQDGYFDNKQIDRFFVFGGTNDSWRNYTLGDIKKADWTKEDLKCVIPSLCYLFSKIKSVCKDAKITAIINTQLMEGLSDGIISVCNEFDAEYVKLEDIEKLNGHPTTLGMKQIAKQIKEKIS